MFSSPILSSLLQIHTQHDEKWLKGLAKTPHLYRPVCTDESMIVFFWFSIMFCIMMTWLVYWLIYYVVMCWAAVHDVVLYRTTSCWILFDIFCYITVLNDITHYNLFLRSNLLYHNFRIFTSYFIIQLNFFGRSTCTAFNLWLIDYQITIASFFSSLHYATLLFFFCD